MSDEVKIKSNGESATNRVNQKKPATRGKLFQKKAATTVETESAPAEEKTVQTTVLDGTLVKRRFSLWTLVKSFYRFLSRTIRWLFFFGIIIAIVAALVPEFKNEFPVLNEFGLGILKGAELLLRVLIRFFVNLFTFNFKVLFSESWAILEEGWKAMILWFMNIH
jgi:hypothetical protein